MHTIKCKHCERLFNDSDSYVAHLEKYHLDLIPPDMNAYQYYYYLKTGKTAGKCIICGHPTKWNNKTRKYKRFCENQKCKEVYVQTFRNRMIGKHGKITLLNDPEQQKKMLANRKISGEYEWSRGHKKIRYTGSYELSFLKFLDQIVDFDPNDILSPSPHIYYYIYNGKKHFYIPDFFIPSLNLEIEIKDGDPNDPNSNHHPKIMSVDRVKESLKDEVMKTNGNNFNYLKIMNRNNKRFFEYLELAKEKLNNGDTTPIFMI